MVAELESLGASLHPVIERARRVAKDAPEQPPLDIEHARAAREERLAWAKPDITAEDARALVSDTVEATPALHLVRRLVDAFEADEGTGRTVRFLVLLGGVGCGKTVAGAWALSRMWGRYLTAEEWRRLYVSKSWRDQQRLEDALRARLLVVDDLGAEQEEGRAAAFQELLQGRYGHARRLTIVTGNLTKAQLYDESEDALLDRRTVSRLHDPCVHVHQVGGPDLRRRGQEAAAR